MKKGKFKISFASYQPGTQVPEIEYEFYYIQTRFYVNFYDCDPELRDKSIFRFFKKAGGRNFAFKLLGDMDDADVTILEWKALIKKELEKYQYTKKRKLQIVRGQIFEEKSTSDVREEKLKKILN